MIFSFNVVVLVPPNVIDHCMKLQLWATPVSWNKAMSVFQVGRALLRLL